MPDISIDRTTYIKIGNSDPLTTGIAEGTMLIDRVLFAQDFLFGQFASSMFEIQIYGIANVAGQKIEVYQLENNVRTDLFVGQVESSKLDNAGYYRDIIAFDKFYFIAKKNVADWFNGLWTNITEISVLDAYKSLLAHFDIDYDPNTVTAANFSGTLHKDSVVSFEKISFKDTVKYLLEPLGLIPYINESGKGAVFSPSMTNAVDLSGKYDVNQSVFEEYTVKPMQWVGIQNIDSAILQQTEITGNTSDIRYDLSYNPIRLDLYVEDGETARTAVLTNFTNKANFTEYKPCEVFMIVSDMSIELGDQVTTTRGTAYVSEIILSGPMLVEQQLISRGSQVQQEVEEEYDPVFAYLDNRITETADDLQQQLDDFQPSDEYLEKVSEFSDTIAGGMGLQVITYKAQDGSLLKYFYAPPTAGSAVTGISGSNFIFTMKSTGFAWTNKWEGAPDASSESHVDPGTGETVSTTWTSGISKDGNALLKILNAYKVSADILEGGTLQIKDAAGNVVHSFTNGSNAPMDIGGGYLNGGMSYDTDNGLRIASSVSIGGTATIGDTITNEVEKAVDDLDIKGIDHETVEYAISTSGSKIPSDGGTSGHIETLYAILEDPSDDYLETITTKADFEAARENFEINTLPEVFSRAYLYTHIYSFTRADIQNGDFLLGNWNYLGLITPGSSTTILSGTLYCEADTTPTQDEILNKVSSTKAYSVPIVPDMANGNMCVSFTATLLSNGNTAISDVQPLYTAGSSDTSTIDTVICFAAITTASNIKNALERSLSYLSPYASIEYGEIWGSTFKYFYRFSVTVKANGEYIIGDDYELMATYGSSYAEFDDDVMTNWSSTMPDVSINKGKYLWTRTVTTYTDGTTSVPVYQATYIGQNGAAGASGIGITTKQIRYAIGEDGENAPSSGWQQTVPETAQGDYLWTRTVLGYSDGTSTTSYSVSYIGTDGQDGDSVTVSNPTYDPSTKTTMFTLTDKNGSKTVTIHDGEDGDEGEHVHFAWANSSDGTTDFSTSNSANKLYIGVCADANTTDPQTPASYSWTLIKGSNGTSVTVSSIKYAKNQDQSTQPSASSFGDSVPTLNPGDWLWTKTTYSDNSTAITKSYIGSDGDDGDSVLVSNPVYDPTNKTTTFTLTDKNGSKTVTLHDGEDGDEGEHVHFAWANSADGTTDFSTSVSTNKQYIGVCADGNTADPQTPSSYSWTLIKGATGAAGRGISSITQYYYASSSDNVNNIPAVGNGSWVQTPSSTNPAFSETNRYLWTYTKTVYTNPSSTVNGDRYILGVWGATGSGGGGTAGRGIQSIEHQYCLKGSINEPFSFVRANKSASFSDIVKIEYVPSITATYTFQSTGSADTIGYIFSSSGTQLVTNDDDGDGNNFLISYTMNAGTTYYLAARFYYDKDVGGTIDTTLTTGSITTEWSTTPPRYKGGLQYYERDKIVWTDSSTPQYIPSESGVASNGLNEACRAANELNYEYARFIVKESNKTYIDGAKIYTGSVTADAIAANTITANEIAANTITSDQINTNKALIDALMTNKATVTDGQIQIIGGDAPETITDQIREDTAQALWGKAYDSCNYAQKLVVNAAAWIMSFKKASKLFATTGSADSVEDGETMTALFPNCLKVLSLDSNQTGNDKIKTSSYGIDADVRGNLTVHGDLSVQGSTSGYGFESGQISFISNGSSAYSANVMFDNTYSSAPKVYLTPMFPNANICVFAADTQKFVYAVRFETAPTSGNTYTFNYLVIP